MSTTLDNNQYWFKTLPIIDYVSVHKGSSEGGTLIKIGGSQFTFDSHVQVDDTPCFVTDIQESVISCSLEKQTYSSNFFVGGSGLTKEVWEGQNDDDNDDDTSKREKKKRNKEKNVNNHRTVSPDCSYAADVIFCLLHGPVLFENPNIVTARN